jgi:DNA-binding MarR family transcriptional regulator
MDVTKTLDLQDYLPYLLNRCALRIVDSFTGELRGFGISLAMWRSLAALHHDGAMRLGELARLTSIEISTLSRTVATLHRRGLVLRDRSDRDARAICVALTEDGRALTERIIPLALRCEASALNGFAPEDGERLRDLLRRLFANLNEAEAAPQRHAGEALPADLDRLGARLATARD